MMTQIMSYDEKLLKFDPVKQKSELNSLTCKDVIVTILALIFLSKANVPGLIILAWSYSLKKMISKNIIGAQLDVASDCSNQVKPGLEI